ncbi:MAG: hypothetical protein NC095_07690 [Muribaculum sp.]|nr:hypothetical protein [Muribaculum sp.]
MLTILIDGKRAAIKESCSFELVAENSRFDKSDSYTLDISFPLKDCPQNVEIFGMMFRKDASPSKYTFSCDIIDKAFQMSGSVIVTEFSETEVKCQFLEGKSGASLTSPLSDIYINEIKIASPDTNKNNITPRTAWDKSRECVALPWVNNDTGIMQNKTSYNASPGTIAWSNDCLGLSWMPYLTTVIKGICKAIGFSCDISAIENDESLKYLLVCNALPYAWYNPEVAIALPHWTVEEFFSNLEDFLFGEFRIDLIGKSVSFRSAKDIYENAGVVEIKTDINEFSADVFVRDSECKALDVANISYQESDHQMQKFYDCNWLVKMFRSNGNVLEYDTLEDLMEAHQGGFQFIDDKGHRNSNMGKLYYVRDMDKYFCTRTIYKNSDEKTWKLDLQPVNEFGARIIDDSDGYKKVELKFVPACIDMTDLTYGYTLFNSPGSTYGDSNSSEVSIEDADATLPSTSGDDGNHRGNDSAVDMVIRGESNSEQSEFYDRIYLGWWDGIKQFSGATNPFPNVSDSLHIWKPISVRNLICNFSLASKDSVFNRYANDIDTSVRYNIKFISDSLPNPKSIFLIKGRKYICEKLTASVTVRGMSSLIKGVFWPLKG